MHIPSTASTSGRRSRLLTFARSHGAKLCAIRTDLDSAEAAQLSATLDRLVEIGAVALYCLDTPLNEAEDWPSVVDHLQTEVGSLYAEAAIGAAKYPATPTPKPQTLVPVWPFERLSDDSDVLTACGLFMGAPIAFEAMPVLDPELALPTPAVAARFAGWRAALGSEVVLGTVGVPGRDEAHAVFASVRAG